MASPQSMLDDKMRKRLEYLARKGFTEQEMADALLIDQSTITKWKQKFPDFWEALNQWKDAADREVERSLFERAKGFKCLDTKFATHEGVITDQKEYIKHYPPDTTAAIFWLKNRRRDTWRDQFDHKHSGTLARATDEELDNKIRSLIKVLDDGDGDNTTKE